MIRPSKLALRASLSLLLLASAACKDDDDDDHDHLTEESVTGDCAVIIEACHDADEGSGAAHACHELAHDNNQSACTPKKDECVAACAAQH